MSDTTRQSDGYLTDAHNNIDDARKQGTYDAAMIYVHAAQVQATMAHALEVRALRELLEDRLQDEWSRYGDDL